MAVSVYSAKLGKKVYGATVKEASEKKESEENKKSGSENVVKTATVTQVEQNAPIKFPGEDRVLIATKEEIPENNVILTAEFKKGKVTKGTKQDLTKQIYTPAQTITPIEDSYGRVVGYEDTQTRQSVAAPENTYYKRRSIADVEEKRRETAIKNASLQAIATESRVAQEKAKTQEEAEAAIKKQIRQETEVITGKTPDEITQGLRTDYSDEILTARPAYYDKEQIETLYKKAQPQEITILGKRTGIKTSAIKSENVGMFSRGLEKSGYYNLISRPRGVTITPKYQEEEQLRALSGNVYGKLGSFYGKKQVEYLVKPAAIVVGGTYLSLSLANAKLAQAPLAKTVIGIGSKALQVGYAVNVASRGYKGLELARKGDYESASFVGADIGTELIGFGVMKAALNKPFKFDKPYIVEKRGDVYIFERGGTRYGDIFGGKFKQEVKLSGVIKDKEIAYSTRIFNKKGQLLSQTFGKVNPTNYEQSEIDKFTNQIKAEYLGAEGKTPTKLNKKIGYKGTIQYTDLSKKDVVVPEGAKRLYGIRTGNFNPQLQSGVEGYTVDVSRTKYGYPTNLITKTKTEFAAGVFKSDLLKAAQPVGLKTRQTGSLSFEPLGETAKSSYGVIKKVAEPLFLSKKATFSLSFTLPTKETAMPTKGIFGTMTGYEGLLFEPNTAGAEGLIFPSRFSLRTKQETITGSKSILMPSTKLELENKKRGKGTSIMLLNYELIRPQEEKQEALMIPKPTTKTRINQQELIKPKAIQQQDQIITQELKQEQIIDTKPMLEPKPIPGSTPIIIPPIPPLPGFGMRELPKTSDIIRPGRLQKKEYTPSLLGIARGRKATRTTNLSGFEIRGIQSTRKEVTFKKSGLNAFRAKKKKKKERLLLKRLKVAL